MLGRELLSPHVFLLWVCPVPGVGSYRGSHGTISATISDGSGRLCFITGLVYSWAHLTAGPHGCSTLPPWHIFCHGSARHYCNESLIYSSYRGPGGSECRMLMPIGCSLPCSWPCKYNTSICLSPMYVCMCEITGKVCCLLSSSLRGIKKKIIIIMSCIPMALPKTKESPKSLWTLGSRFGLDPPYLVWSQNP